MMKNISLILCVGLLFSCQQKTNNKKGMSQSYQDTPENYTDSIYYELSEIHKRGLINGFSVAIVNDDKTLYEGGIGYANTATGEKYTANTLQNIASVSKTFIGIALFKAQEMGKLKLDDPINDYLPFEVKNPYYPEEPITIRHLATHTSTIIDTEYYDKKAYVLKDAASYDKSLSIDASENFNLPETSISMSAFLEKVLHQKGEWYKKEGFLNRKPGTLFEYSNIGATLAALVIAQASGETFDTFTQRHILEPLGMADSGWSFDAIDFSKHTTLYANPETVLPHYSLITYPDGGMRTSIHDLSKYLTELIKGYSGSGTLLTDASYKALFKPQLKPENFTDHDNANDYNDEYNTGIFMGHTPKGYLGHTGGDPGVATYMFFDPKYKIGRILLINTNLENEAGIKAFFAIWDVLGKYASRIAEKQ